MVFSKCVVNLLELSYHLEARYKFKVNHNIHITPGVIMIFNPENHSANSTVAVRVIPTTFNF